MMKPKKYYAVFCDGRVIHICLGAEEARRITPHRAYRSFRSRLEAEEFAAWWNYANTKERTFYRNRPSLSIDYR